MTPTPPNPDPLLAEQVAYYRAIAAEYEDHALPDEGADELCAALDTLRPPPRQACTIS